MSDFLKQMAESSRNRAQALIKRDAGLAPLAAPPLRLGAGFDLIAELKPASPSEGDLSASVDLDAQVLAYAEGGAAAVSVLTEPSRFGGSLELLAHVARQLAPHGVPVMRKDFLVHPRQIDEAAAAGAGGVLLMVSILDPEQLEQMVSHALSLRRFVLMEAFDAEELRTAVRLAEGRENQVLVGLNSRDLRTLQVQSNRFTELASMLPSNHICVAESGLDEPQDTAQVSQLGYRMALVGSALMRAPNPSAKVRQMIAHGRAASGLPRVKICGLKTFQDVDAAVSAGADGLGFVLVDSPRRISPEQARLLANNVPDHVATFGVFRTVDVAAVEMTHRAGLGWVQGAPTPDGLATASALGIRCMVALQDNPELVDDLGEYSGPLLVDGPKSGSGQVADLTRVASLSKNRPLLLAGGLRPDSVADIIQRVRPLGVDVSSGVESQPGVKDPHRIQHFVRVALAALQSVHNPVGEGR